MYDTHYGLADKPFQLTPDPHFWFDTASHRKAMAYLGYGLSQGEGFIVITGEPGTGKTTLIGHLLSTIDAARLNVIRMVTTQVEPDDLLRIVAAGLEVDPAGKSKAELLRGIERGLHAVARTGRRTLLIVDEAQSLPVAGLEELRMLSNFQAGGHALLQIFLVGQPEFRERLYGADRLEQLRQRVIAMHQLGAMESEEVEPYLVHRLGRVGWQGRPDFTVEAIGALHRWSGGVPRRLNLLMGRVLLHGAVEDIDQFDAADVEGVAAELAGDGWSENGATPTAAADASVQVAAPAPAAADPRLAGRIEALEARLDEQDRALRRVLTLLVDWVEGDQRKPDAERLRSTVAA